MASNYNNSVPSAICGKPPNSQRDYYIVRALLREYGLASSLDPADGFPVFPSEPTGYTHEDKRPQIIVGLIIITLSIVVPTGARLIIRARNAQMVWGSDDWTIILAATTSLLFPVSQIIVVARGGGGLHIWEVTYAEYSQYIWWGSIAVTIHYVVIGLIKISITLFLRRLTSRASLRWRVFCDTFIATLVLYVIYAAFSTSMYCNPARATFSLEAAGELEQAAQCFSLLVDSQALSIVHVVQGFMLLGSPIVMLWKVRMDQGKKIRLYVIWAVGGLAVLGGLFDLFFGHVTTVNYDYTYTYDGILGWGAVDIVFGLLTASLPVLDAWILGAWRGMSSLANGLSGRGPSSKATGGAVGSAAQGETLGSGGVCKSFRSSATPAETHTSRGGDDVELGILMTRDIEVQYLPAERQTDKAESFEELICPRAI